VPHQKDVPARNKKQSTRAEKAVAEGVSVAVPRTVRQLQAAERFTTAIALLGGRTVGSYKKALEKVHCICAKGHDCYPVPGNIQQGVGMCRKCAGRCPEEAEKAFKASIVAKGGRVIGEYIRSSDGVHCICVKGHDCYPLPSGIKQGEGMCRKCAGCCTEEAEKAFRASIAAQGGRVIGEYVRSADGVHCVCASGHDCNPTPSHIQQGVGMCRKCAGRCPEEARKTFNASIAAQGGRVVGEYIRSSDGVHCICAKGHDCHPSPNSIQQGQGMCLKCAGHCSEEAEKAFKALIAAKGGRVIGAYIRSTDGVHCICANGHDCHPTPAHVQQGQGMCLKCAGCCPDEAEKAFNASIAAQGGRIVGEYIRSADGIHCICAKGHDCYPLPSGIRQGQGMCRKCTGLCPEEAEKAFKASIVAHGGRVVGEHVSSKEGVHCVCAKGHECHPRPSHIQRGVGMCRRCAPSSYGELAVMNALKLLGLEFQVEFRFKPDKRRYDFCLEKDRIMIEFDGIQHFKVGGSWMETEEDLLENQENDRQKQALALARGFRMMRFDFSWSRAELSQITAKIRWFIHECTDSVWVTNPELYEWLLHEGASKRMESGTN
jgi:very-short-patch-repair endonuclease